MYRNEQVYISRASFLAGSAHAVAHKSLCRPYLETVRVEPCKEGGIFLIATNGNVMSIFRDKDGRTDKAYNVPVPPTLITAAKYTNKSRHDAVVIANDEIRLKGSTKIYRKPCELNVENFIDWIYLVSIWRKYAPTTRSNTVYQAEALGTFNKILSTAYGLDKLGQNTIKFNSVKGSDVVLVTSATWDWFGMVNATANHVPVPTNIPFNIDLAEQKDAIN